MSIRCKRCGLKDHGHEGYAYADHEFVPDMPKGCTCDYHDWFDKVTPICAEFKQWEKFSDEDICEECQHSKECHDK